MKINAFARLTINIAAFVSLVAAALPLAYGESEVRFQLVRDVLIIVPVMTDDEGPFYFLLDTGADTTIVDSGLAKKLSLFMQQSAMQATATGSQTVNVSRLARLTLGSAQVKGLPVLEEDLSSLRRMDSRILGIVGQDVLSRFDYLLDYRARSLRIEKGDEIRAAINGDPIPVEAGHNRMILAAEAQSLGHAKVRLLLDSGTNALVLMGSATNELHCPMVQQGVQSSLAGVSILRTSRIDLTIASREFHDLPVSLVAKAPSQDIGDGLLPTSLFDGLYVSNSQRFVILNPTRGKLRK